MQQQRIECFSQQYDISPDQKRYDPMRTEEKYNKIYTIILQIVFGLFKRYMFYLQRHTPEFQQ